MVTTGALEQRLPRRPAVRLVLLTGNDITGGRGATTRDMRKMPSRRRNTIDPLELRAGDFVVHEQHGIGRYVEMVQRTVNGADREYLVIEYAASKRGQPGDRLFVPTDSLDQLSRYVGGEHPTLHKLGGSDWQKAKARARKAVREIAAQLIQLYAARQNVQGPRVRPGHPVAARAGGRLPVHGDPGPARRDRRGQGGHGAADPDGPADLRRRRLRQDRDRGAGGVQGGAGRQAGGGAGADHAAGAAALQHLHRADGPVPGADPAAVAVPDAEGDRGDPGQIARRHASTSSSAPTGCCRQSTRFKHLGLVIVDEEQRFGVEHKEHLKQLRASVDVLTMSATPIPRTLEMAITGIREMSTIATPPEERHPVLTFVGAQDDRQVAAAIHRELLRDGQVFYLHNRVESIDRAARRLRELVPEARVAVAHGQMGEDALEKVMVGFWEKEFDVLVCTTIVESGIDIPNANTLIVERADLLGLAQLHQIRGRVGRGRERAYAYFLYPPEKPLTEHAHERLATIAQHTELGAGMYVAMKDLEIRGAGNLLGGEQSGHIEGVGFDLYVRMVGEAVAAFKGEAARRRTAEVKVDLPVDAHLPHDYVGGGAAAAGDVPQARRGPATRSACDEVVAEMRDRYGEPPGAGAQPGRGGPVPAAGPRATA